MSKLMTTDFEPSLVVAASKIALDYKLYGRNQEVAQLLAALDRVMHGRGEVVLLPGASGTGKTALAHTLREPAKSRNGFFLEGKFNQYDQNIAYGAWRQALAEFCQVVDREDISRQKWWAQRILDSVKAQGRLLVDLVPEFQGLLGIQPPVDTISPQESRHRFAAVIRDTLSVICQPEHPLVLFIDDWQWADPASLDLLLQLEIDASLRYVLIVVAYRSDEVQEQPGFQRTLMELRSQQVPINTTVVENLSIEDLESLISEVASPSAILSPELVNAVHWATGGNVFFARSLLDNIHSNDRSFGSSENHDFPTHFDLPSDIVDLFERRIANLPANTKDLISLASCLGHRFDLNTLAIIADRSVDECSLALMPAKELLEPFGDCHERNENNQKYRFIHDRIQQAAYARIKPNDLPAIRLSIARQMLSRLGKDELFEQAFEIANHFTAGANLFDSSKDVLQGVELNVAAARKAHRAAAFRSSLEYYRAAKLLITSRSTLEIYWREHFEATFAIHLEQAEVEYLEGDHRESERLIRQAVLFAETTLQKAQALTLLIVQHTLQGRYDEAIATGREALAAIGMTLPDKDFENARDASIEETNRLMNGRTVADVVNMPAANDELAKTAAKILITMGPACYRAHQQLWSVIVPRVVSLSLRYGHVPQIGYSHTALAGLLGWVSGNFESGRIYCEIASQLMTPPFASSSDQAVFHLMMGSSARHWYQHPSESTSDYSAAIETGRRSGNMQYAAYAFGHNMYCRFFQGAKLDELLAETRASLSFSKTRQNQWAIELLSGGLRVFEGLLGTQDKPRLKRESEVDFLASIATRQKQQVACIYRVMKAQQFLLLGDFAEALAYLKEASLILHTVGTQGLLPWPEYVFARALAISAMAREKSVEQAKDLKAELTGLIEQLRLWSEQCPENFMHKFFLASGEAASLNGSAGEAIDFYDESIRFAKAHGFVQWEGYANERAAKYWQSLGNGRLEQIYWQRAYDCFERWGAAAKVKQLAEQYHASIAEALRAITRKNSGISSSAEASVKRFGDRHLGLLNDYTVAMAQAGRNERALSVATEMASAADSLRMDVAAERQNAKSLREQRDAEEARKLELERRVKERTAELEATAKELQMSEARFRASVDAAPVGIVMINEVGEIVLANSTLCKLFGYRQEEVIGQKIELFIPKQARQGHVALRGGFLANPSQRSMGAGRDLFGQHKNGTVIPVEVGLTPIQLDSGPGVLGTIVDLTARKKAEASLRQSEETHRLVVEGVKDYAIISLDLAGRITSWNVGAERILGYRADEILGRTVTQFLPESVNRIELAELELRTAATTGRFEDENWRVRKNGDRFWANVIVTALRDGSGSLVGYSKITRDLTERKLAEHAIEVSNRSLKESQAVLRTLIDESMNFTGVMKVDGTLIDANRTALRAAGVEASDVLNQKFVDTPWWQHSSALQNRLREAIVSAAAGRPDGFEATHLDADGNMIFVDFSLKPVKNELGEVIYLIPEGRDTTSHKEREAELQRLILEVKRSNDELEQFAYVASHDLQEPLRKIASYCKLLQEEKAENLDEEGRHYLDVAIDGARRLQTLVRDLLTFARITTRGKPLSTTNTVNSLQEAINSLSLSIEERGAVITFDPLPKVMADAGQLTHLFQNLIGNAIKYCSSPVPEVHVGSREKDGELEIFVRDNGIGIDPKFHEKIFQVFQRLHNRKEYSGTGIGLALCKRIVERFGGQIRVDSSTGEGSTFIFTIKKAK
jgi:PAS domain S-box-containing protein